MSLPVVDTERNGVATYFAKDVFAWRTWLETHHQTADSVWLIIYHKQSAVPSITYEEAVEEALCFGWVDSKPNKRDQESFYQYFAARNPKSNWSARNKSIIERLKHQGRMATAGEEMVRIAKSTGTWDALNDVENLIIPEDMQPLFDKDPVAFKNFEAFPRSVKRGILEWIHNAKRASTRQRRIEGTVTLARQNIRANQYRK